MGGWGLGDRKVCEKLNSLKGEIGGVGDQGLVGDGRTRLKTRRMATSARKVNFLSRGWSATC